MYRQVFASKLVERKVMAIFGGCAGLDRTLAMQLALVRVFPRLCERALLPRLSGLKPQRVGRL
ncbi:hypothetical protein [Pseudomonas sp.]|uniref:hypothetical protein n=1 Tax=Pseudomonas sp. TaxID=306 RepID=UPI0027329843|nr:hypothetical protein [Pseudomonas sp.]MDP3816980.1 hypothetical protein [Pseudomonas sp.]